MSEKITVVLVYGGKSGEHEISLISAASVLANLNPDKYTIIPVGMDKEGHFYVNDYNELLRYSESLPVRTLNSKPIPSLLVNGSLAVPAEVVFPVVHGPLYEDGCLQGLLKLAGAAFVGSDVLSSAIGMDKDIARRLVCTDGEIQCAKYQALSWHTTQAQRRQFCQDVVSALGLPLFVKPCALGSSVGIHKANNMPDLVAAVEDALRYDDMILVEAFIEGREIELAVLENANPGEKARVSLPGEIRVNHTDGFYSYSAKYLESNATELLTPAELNSALVTQLQNTAAEIFARLKCKGMARVDFFVNEKTGVTYFNEINTLPGFTPISMYPKLWQVSGLSYTHLLDQLIQLAMTHHHCRQNLVTSYQ